MRAGAGARGCGGVGRSGKIRKPAPAGQREAGPGRESYARLEKAHRPAGSPKRQSTGLTSIRAAEREGCSWKRGTLAEGETHLRPNP